MASIVHVDGVCSEQNMEYWTYQESSLCSMNEGYYLSDFDLERIVDHHYSPPSIGHKEISSRIVPR